LFKEFHKLSINIKFINFGSLDLPIFNFEVGTSIEFGLKMNNSILNLWAAREKLNGPKRNKRGKASPAAHLVRVGSLTGGARVSVTFKQRNGTSEPETLD
jgi:hypothetical protein